MSHPVKPRSQVRIVYKCLLQVRCENRARITGARSRTLSSNPTYLFIYLIQQST